MTATRASATQAQELMRNAYRGLVCADILRKMLHKTRPYEVHRGDTDAVHERAIHAVAARAGAPGRGAGRRACGSSRRPCGRPATRSGR